MAASCGDAASAGAEVGAQARFARANRGRGVAGRTIEYLRTEPAADGTSAEAAAARLRDEVFAVVPAVGSSVGAEVSRAGGFPVFGIASTPEWYANRVAFGISGAAASERARIARSPLGVLVEDLLGGARGKAVSVFHDDDTLGTARGAQAQRSLRAAGFTTTMVPVPAPPAVADPVALAASASPDVAVLVTAPARAAALAAQLVADGYVGAIVVGGDFYAPGAAGVASGLTVLVPIAPTEEATAANRRLAADVETFAPGTVVTPAVASGYWSADLFVRLLERTGRRLTRAHLLDVANGDEFTYEVKGTVGKSTWPEMHAQPVPCGSLLQSDGTQYFVLVPYRCAPPAGRAPR